MADPNTFEDFRDAWDSTTGRKVGRVPHHWFDLFPNLRKTPVQKAQEKKPDTKKATSAASEKE